MVTVPGGTIEAAAAAGIGTAISGEIAKPDQNDFYRFDVPLKQRDLAVIRLQNQSSTLKPDLKMFSANKSQTGEKYFGTPGANLDFSFKVEPGKDFYLQVLPYGSTGKYRLSVKPEAVPAAAAP